MGRCSMQDDTGWCPLCGPRILPDHEKTMDGAGPPSPDGVREIADDRLPPAGVPRGDGVQQSSRLWGVDVYGNATLPTPH
jgi:hypothetical protein